MKIRIATKVLYIFLVLSVFTPWFTYNASMMGYCWGFYFLKWITIPVVLIGIYLFRKAHSEILWILSEIASISMPLIYINAFGRWQEICNINSGYHWVDGFRTAQPGYWISVALLLAFLIVFHIFITDRSPVDSTRKPKDFPSE